MIKIVASVFNKNIIKVPSAWSNLQLINLYYFSNVQKENQERILSKATYQHDVKVNTSISQSANANIPSKTRASSYENISNEGKRIELEIFATEQQPSFIKEYIQNSKPAKYVKYFNPHLTNGGQDYEEFPLIKLISIALKNIEEDNIQPSSWKSLQFYIRKRLHRCTIEQNLKLLYIMLKSFPKYTFNYDFIMSICLALKKEMNLMSSEQLKSFFYVLYTNRNEVKRYNNPILSNLQSLILAKVYQKCEKKLKLQQASKGIHLPIEYLYAWIMFGFTLSVRNNYFQLIFQDRAIQLMKHYNQRWKAAVLKEQQNKIHNEGEIVNILYFACIFERLANYQIRNDIPYPKRQKINEKPTFRQEFDKFKMNIIAHTSNKIDKIMKQSSSLQKIRAFRSLLQLYPLELVQNLMQLQQQTEQAHSNDKYQKINHTFTSLMKIQDRSQEVIIQKIKILSNLFSKGLLSLDMFKSHYRSLSINFKQIKGSLDIVNELIRLQLYIFAYQDIFNPQINLSQFVLDYLESSTHTYRNFDWHSFHFVSQLIEKTINESPSISSNLPAEVNQVAFNEKQQKLRRILKKISQQVNFYNTSKLVNHEIQLLKQKQTLKRIEKFFIEIRVNQMQKLKPIISPFDRLPHFSNEKQQIAINSLTEEQMNQPDYRLEKKLLNISGWKVVNVNHSHFLELSLNERLKFIADNLQKQTKVIESIRKSSSQLIEHY